MRINPNNNESLKNWTNEKGKGVVLKHEEKPVAVLMPYEDYLKSINDLDHFTSVD